MNRCDLLLESLRKEVLVYFPSGFEDYSHEISHTERVVKLVKILHKKEGGDILILSVAALLHDIARAQQERGECSDHAIRGGEIARTILVKYNLSNNVIDQIVYCIQHHRSKTPGETLESKILKDADKLDALGAISICRIIASSLQSKQYCRPIFDQSVPLKGHEKVSAIHYLTLLIEKYEEDNYLQTKAAKNIAKARIDIMKQFVQNFKKEWFLN